MQNGRTVLSSKTCGNLDFQSSDIKNTSVIVPAYLYQCNLPYYLQASKEVQCQNQEKYSLLCRSNCTWNIVYSFRHFTLRMKLTKQGPQRRPTNIIKCLKIYVGTCWRCRVCLDMDLKKKILNIGRHNCPQITKGLLGRRQNLQI